MHTPSLQKTRIISIGGGKGGVGKSVVSSNLAVALAREGRRTILVDADLGAANQHTLFGLGGKIPTLHTFLNHDVQRLEDTLVPTGITNLKLIAGTSATPGAANIPHQQKLKLIRSLGQLDAQVILIDVGAGTSFNVLDLYLASDLRLMVLTPQLTSLQNGYAFMKSAVHRMMKQTANSPERKELCQPLLDAGETAKLSTHLDALEKQDPGYAEMLRCRLQNFGAQVIGNQLDANADKNTIRAISKMLSDYLGVEAPLMGMVPLSADIRNSINQRSPYLTQEHVDPAIDRMFRSMVDTLLGADVERLRAGRKAADPSSQVPVRTSLKGLKASKS